ncbi:YihY/virulence factor BrkB family protein [Palleronia caenipelagi]|uniref:YihY/virulence factor BrkB family protein n=2 Tax=Palleronia caenipelagi TaxID=2489174 RepID=A0A547Q5U7_9RHOB|nr:YihY/virulence factor BrkB family protein [Palleronia caenipelagi]
MPETSPDTSPEPAPRRRKLLPGLGWRKWFGAIKAVILGLNDSNLALYSAGIAFYGMLSVFPAIGAVVAIWGFFADPVEVAEQLAVMEEVMPEEAYDIVYDQVTQIVGAANSTLGWTTFLSLGAALWSSRAGVASLIRALNAIYGQRNRQGLRQIATASAITLLLIGVSLVALLSVVVLPVVLNFVPLGPVTEWLVASVRWVVALGVVIVAIGMIYRFGPNRRKARLPWVTPGAIVAMFLWGLVSWGFSYYLSNFGNYNEIYGTLGAVIALLMWMFLSAFTVLLGAALNAELELRTYRDSTVGPDRPMGYRKAVVADNYIEK